MARHNFALVSAVLGCSMALGGCTPHDTNSTLTDATSGSAGASATDGGANGANTAPHSMVGGVEAGNSEASGAAGSASEDGVAGSSATDAAGSSESGGTAGSSALDGTAGLAAGGSASSSSGSSTPLNGYTLYAYMDTQNNYTHSELIDMSGGLVNTWSVGGIPVKMMPGGDLIGENGIFPGDYDAIKLSQVSWSGAPRWAFQDWAAVGDGTFASRQHHDFEREGNPVGYWAPGQTPAVDGATLVLAHSFRTVPEVRDGLLDDDVIYELDATGALKDTVWQGADHLAEFGFDDAALADIRTRNPGTALEWLHGNSISLVGPNHWFDEGHSEFAPNNIIYSSRNANFIVIIERETGQVVWRIGPDFAARPEHKLGQFSGQHNPHMIPKGLPGAGNLLVFDNGGLSGYGGSDDSYRYLRGWSRVVEFNPVTMDIVWQYGSATGSDSFYSAIISNEQRLPNGNTVITIGLPGRVIEVTPSNQIVWEYDYVPGADRGLPWLYRSYRIPPDWLPEGVNTAHGNYPLWGDLYPR